MTELITGAKGSAHVTSAQQGAINAYTIGPGAYILDGCAATLQSANTLHIAAGHLMVQGRAIEVTATDLTIANGTQGTKRNDLACVHYALANNIETTTLTVVQGTPSATPVDPTVSGSILAGDATADIPLWRVTLDGITPTVKQVAANVNGLFETALQPDVLYNGGNALTYDTSPGAGTNGTVTLSEDVSHFKQLTIFYGYESFRSSVTLTDPANQITGLYLMIMQGVGLWIKTRNVFVNGTSISTNSNSANYCVSMTNGAVAYYDMPNPPEVLITRVEGIR